MGGSTVKRVFGRVQDGDGKPVAGATVVFSSTFGGQWKAETNRKGRYEVEGNLYTSGSRDEKWTVTLEATGYLPVSARVRALHANGSVFSAFVQDLEKAPALAEFRIPRLGTVEVNWTLGDREFVESRTQIEVPGAGLAGVEGAEPFGAGHEAFGLAPVPISSERIPVTEGAPDLPELDLILRRLSSLARLYADGALGFTCDELIRYRRSGFPGGKVKYRYIYRRLDGKLEDYRTFKKSGRDTAKKQDIIHYPGPVILRRPYSWVFSFEASRQPLNAYRILGTGEVLGRPAVKLWVQPAGPESVVPEVNDWVGEFWIDRETFQLLRVDALGLDEYLKKIELDAAFESARAAASVGKVARTEHSVERFTTVFGVVDQGIRYPSQVVIERRRFEVPIDESTEDGVLEYRVLQRYSNYRFYSTAAIVRIEQIVGGR